MLIKEPTRHFPHNILIALWNLPNFTTAETPATNLRDGYPNCNAFHKEQLRTEETCDSLKSLSAVDTAEPNLLREKQFKFLHKGLQLWQSLQIRMKI